MEKQTKVPPQSSSDRMGTAPVNQLLLSMAMPIIVAMVIQALYNIVDSAFVARVSENALSAVSLVYPFQMLMIAFSTGLGAGMNAALSRSLGESDGARANRVALHGLLLTAIISVVFMVVGTLGARAYMLMQTDIPEIVEAGTVYMKICAICSAFLFFEITFERLLQATGRTSDTLISQGIGAVLNIILDPIMIFGYFGFPEMGVAGAALATVIGQMVSCVVALVLNVKRNKELKLNFRGFRVQWDVIKAILVVAIPSILMQAVGSVMNFGMNKILLTFTSTATAVFGVYYKLQSMIFLPVIGLNNAMVPIIAYNYGARNRDRMLKTLRLALTYAVSFMLLGVAIMQIFPKQMLMIFKASEDMLSIGIPALRIISLSFILAGFSIVTSSMFQALGNGVYSMLMSIIRQMVVLLPAAYLLSLLGRVELVWWSFPIAELAAAACTAFFFLRIKKRVFDPLKN